MYSATLAVPGFHSRRGQPSFMKFQPAFIEHLLEYRCWSRAGRQSFFGQRQAFQERWSGVHTNVARATERAQCEKGYGVMLIKYNGSSELG